MRQEVKDEAIEQLKNDILFGFETENDLFVSISEMFYEDEDFDEVWFKNEVKNRYKLHLEESKKWKSLTDFNRLVKVFDQLNKEKIVSLHKAGYTRQDAEGDCLEVINDLQEIGINAKGYCYYHTQDLERAINIDDKSLYIGYDSYNQDDSLAKEVANRIVELLKRNNFEVEWSGSIDTRILILNINWQKTPDNIDYNYDRVFSIIENTYKRTPFWKFWK